MSKGKRPRLRMLKPRVTRELHGNVVRTRSERSGMWKSDAVRGNRHQRGYGTVWEKLRREVMERDDGLCQSCLERGRVTAGNEVDHIVPRVMGGTDELKNLRLLCSDCHAAKSREEMRMGRDR